MKIADTDPGIESQLIDLSAISLARLRGLNSSAVRHAMHHALERTGRPRDIRLNEDGTAGERVD